MAIRNPGQFIPTTTLLDVQEIRSVDVTSDEFKDLLVRLYQTTNSIALNLNVKDSGIYSLDEYVTGAEYFPNTGYSSSTAVNPSPRQVFRKVINFGTLPNAGTTNVAHGITVNANITFTRIYGCATNTAKTSFLPLPYSSTTLINNIELSVDNTNVSIITGIDRTSYTTCFVVLEYIKQ